MSSPRAQRPAETVAPRPAQPHTLDRPGPGFAKFSDILRRRNAPADAPADEPVSTSVQAWGQDAEGQGGGEGQPDDRGDDSQTQDQEGELLPVEGAPCGRAAPVSAATPARLGAAIAKRRPVGVTGVSPVDPDAQVVQSQIERLAAAIADLCNDPAVAETGEWSVSLALRPDLLPRTTLMAAVSAHCLRLRFISDDPAARDLLLKRRDELHRLLDESLNRRLEISITLD